jgi:tagatose 1,6-diphosphate aldolase
MDLTAGKLRGVRRLATRSGRFAILGADQRPPIFSLVQSARGTTRVDDEDVRAIKQAIVRNLADRASAVQLDPVWGYPACIDLVRGQQGLTLTLEDHVFRESMRGRVSGKATNWSVTKIKRVGADGVTVLLWYRPDADPSVCRHQEEFVARVGNACIKNDICFVLEPLVYPLASDASQPKDGDAVARYAQRVIESVKIFSDPRFGVDLFNLESPVPAAQLADPGGDAAQVASAQAWFDALGAASHVPWVMMSAGAGMAEFRRIVTYAYRAGASGYLCGRAIWLEACRKFPDMAQVDRGLREESTAFMDELNALTEKMARPWTEAASA